LPFAARGQALDEVDVAAEFWLFLQQRYPVAAPGGDCRRLHPCRSAANDHDLFGGAVGSGLERALTPLALVPGRGIQHAGNFAVLEQSIAALIDSGAFRNLAFAAFTCLREQEGIREQRPHHPHHVGGAVSEHAFGHTEVDDTANDEYARPLADKLLGALAKRDHETMRNRHRRRRFVNRVISATGDVEEVEQPGGREDLQLLLTLLLRDARRSQEFVQ